VAGLVACDGERGGGVSLSVCVARLRSVISGIGCSAVVLWETSWRHRLCVSVGRGIVKMSAMWLFEVSEEVQESELVAWGSGRGLSGNRELVCLVCRSG
jgi:hypothetical protein